MSYDSEAEKIAAISHGRRVRFDPVTGAQEDAGPFSAPTDGWLETGIHGRDFYVLQNGSFSLCDVSDGRKTDSIPLSADVKRSIVTDKPIEADDEPPIQRSRTTEDGESE